MKERLARMNDRDRATESRILCKELEREIGEDAKVIAGFFPLSDEPDIRDLLLRWREAGKTVALPVMERNVLVLRIPASWDTLTPGRLGIPEPGPESPEPDAAALDLVIVPGRAFAKDGSRLGRGNGGYDYWIEKQRKRNPRTRYLGVCFDCQLLPTLPVEAHDQKMDAIVTPRGLVGG